MTHQTIDYSNSPAKAFDAVQDVREWFGRKYDEIAEHMKLVRDPNKFSFYCMLGGVQGYPVKAWYEHFHGEGSWDKAKALQAKRGSVCPQSGRSYISKGE